MNWFSKKFEFKTQQDFIDFIECRNAIFQLFSLDCTLFKGNNVYCLDIDGEAIIGFIHDNVEVSIGVGDTVEIKFGMDSSFVLEYVKIN